MRARIKKYRNEDYNLPTTWDARLMPERESILTKIAATITKIKSSTKEDKSHKFVPYLILINPSAFDF